MLSEGKFSLIHWENEHAHKLTQLREIISPNKKVNIRKPKLFLGWGKSNSPTLTIVLHRKQMFKRHKAITFCFLHNVTFILEIM